MLLLSYGPVNVIPRTIAGIDGIEQAYIYGSWAARRAGEPGSPPADIDVLVVGNPARSAIYAASEEAEKTLGREVNIRVVSPSAWAAATDPFLRTVKNRPLTTLTIEEVRQ